MPIKKAVSAIIGLAILGLTIFFLVQVAKQPKLNQLRTIIKDKSNIFFSNLSTSISPQRKQPLTTIDLEENLKVNLPEPFVNFSQQEWDWFWNLCYGTFTQDSSGWPRPKRQLTREEIQQIFADNYRPFDRFSQQQWNIFWQYVLKGKVFKK